MVEEDTVRYYHCSEQYNTMHFYIISYSLEGVGGMLEGTHCSLAAQSGGTHKQGFHEDR